MSSLPLHPAIVHLPLGLAFVIPLLAAGLAWALLTGRVRSRAWAAIVVLQALLLAGGFAAMKTGEREEDRVERVVPAAALEQHEEYAERFLWATGITLGLTALVLVVRRPSAVRALAIAAVGGTLVVAGTALLVGKAGGTLVYVHNAGAAYAAPPAAAERDRAPAASVRHDRERDERDH